MHHDDAAAGRVFGHGVQHTGKGVAVKVDGQLHALGDVELVVEPDFALQPNVTPLCNCFS